MSSNGIMKSSTGLVKFDFHGDMIDVIHEGERLWVSVRRVCEALGISNQGQQAKLAGKPWASVKVILTQMPGDTQEREFLFVDLDTLPMWLATIDASRVNPLLRPRLIDFQRECARVLRDHFFRPAPQPPLLAPAQFPAITGIVRESTALREELRRLIGANAKRYQISEQRVRGWLSRDSGAASFLRLPLVLGSYYRDRLWRILGSEETAPFNARRALPAPDEQQQLFPRPVIPSA